MKKFSRWTLMLQMIVCHNWWEKTIYIHKCIWWKFVNFIFTPEYSNMVLCYLPFLTPPLLFPFLPVCLVLGFAQAPFSQSEQCSWGVISPPFLKLGFCLYCRTQFPSWEPQSRRVLPQWDSPMRCMPSL